MATQPEKLLGSVETGYLGLIESQILLEGTRESKKEQAEV